MNSALSLFIVGASAGCSWVCCRREFPQQDRALRLLAMLVLWPVLMTVPVHIMAALQLTHLLPKISLFVLAAIELALVLIVFALDRAAPRALFAESQKGSQKVKSDPLPPYLLVGFCVAGLAYCLSLANLWSSFPGGSDALAYHLPLAVRWMQEGSLRMPAAGNWRFSLSGNGEILAMLALFSGKQSLAPLFNLGACILLAVSVYVLARRATHCTRNHALVATLVALSIPVIFFQTVSAYVDLYGTAFILAAVALLIQRDRSVIPGNAPANPSFFTLFVSALACGMSLGTKPTFSVYCGLLLLWVFVALLREQRVYRKPVLPVLVVMAVGVLLPSLFWFSRAWLATGNPLYPIQVRVGGHVLLPGYSPSEITRVDFADKFFRSRMEWPIYPWTEWMRDPSGYFPTSYEESAGTGAAFATFVPLGLAFAIVAGWRDYSKRFAYSIALLTGAGLLAIWAGPLHRMPRFGLPLWSAACIFSAPLFATIEAYYPRVVQTLLIVSLSTTFAISSLLPMHALAGRIFKHRWDRSAIYAYPPLIDNLPAGSRVLNYTGVLDANFPLQGKSLNNEVVAEFEVPGKLTPDFLLAKHIDYIVTTKKDSGDNTHSFAAIDSVTGVSPIEYKGPGRTWYIYKVPR